MSNSISYFFKYCFHRGLLEASLGKSVAMFFFIFCIFLQELRTSAIAKPLELNELENGIKKSVISVQVIKQCLKTCPLNCLWLLCVLILIQQPFLHWVCKLVILLQ